MNLGQETEQRRRDRINEGFQALKALMPTQEKQDKASFLMAAVDYIRQLQVTFSDSICQGGHTIPALVPSMIYRGRLDRHTLS